MTRSTRSLLADFVPPIAARLARRLLGTKPEPNARMYYSGVYPSFEDARRAAGHSYEEAEITEAVHAKTLAYRKLLDEGPLVTSAVERIATTLCLVGDVGPELRVIDFGGAFGTHYWIAKSLIGDRVRLRWHVVETASVCARSAEFANQELRFFDSLEAAMAALGEADLVYADGVLHVLPDPIAWLHRLAACRARYLCVRRLGTTVRATFTVLQFRLSDHEPDVPLPADFVDGPSPVALACPTRESVEMALRGSYDVKFRFGGPSQVYPLGDVTVSMFGYFCELASSGHSRQ